MQGAHATRRSRRPGGGPERSEGIAVSPKRLKRGAFDATRFMARLDRELVAPEALGCHPDKRNNGASGRLNLSL